MTDEQVKQNADNYTESLMCENLHRTMYSSIDFIAGAHSLDEEIKELKEEIESLQEHYNTCFDGFTKRGTKLGELMKENVKLRNENKDLEQALACAEDVIDIQRKELDKLRNPWISVEERLPIIAASCCSRPTKMMSTSACIINAKHPLHLLTPPFDICKPVYLQSQTLVFDIRKYHHLGYANPSI